LHLLGFEDSLGKVVSISVVVEVDIEVINKGLVIDEYKGWIDYIFRAIPLVEAGSSSRT
jgi:hypothetical protein